MSTSPIFQRWADIDWLDQALHVVAGAVIVAVSMVVIPWWAGVLLSLTVAGVREMWQHPWACHAGCRTDLLCWLMGSLFATGVLIFLFER
jgi:hypothetical protein